MTTNAAPGFTRQPRIADQLTPDLSSCLQSAMDAERAGDARQALEWYSAVPQVKRGRHMATIRALAQLDGTLPPWAAARWLVLQTWRCEEHGSSTGDLMKAALKYTTQTVHGNLLDDCYEQGGDPIQVFARVCAESWFFHQIFPFEMGGLADFLDEFVHADFPHADLAREWATVPLRGYRVGDSVPGARLQVHHPVTDSAVDILDLGARSAAGPDGWVVGRLVPSGIDELLAFDTSPLPVSERLAVEMADAPDHGSWAPLADALSTGRLQADAFLREDYEILTDVQELDLLAYGTPQADLDRVMRQLRAGRDEVGRAAFRTLRNAVDGHVPDRDAAFVGAAALNLHAHSEAMRHLCDPSAHERWRRWVSLAASPGRERLAALAEACEGPTG